MKGDRIRQEARSSELTARLLDGAKPLVPRFADVAESNLTKMRVSVDTPREV